MASSPRRYRRFLLVCDDFYRQPMAVWRAARAARYEEPDDATGFHSLSVHHERRVRARLARLLGEGFGPTREAWLGHAAHLGKRVELTPASGRVEGVLKSVGLVK